MSIIVVVKKGGKVVIASDSLYSFGNTKVSPAYIRDKNKIHKIKDSFVGIVGAAAHDNVFQHIIEKEGKKFSFENANVIFDTYLKLHVILKEKYFMNPSESDDDEYESSHLYALVANENGIFGMYSLREVYEFEKFWAIGSGMEFALGSMFSSYETLEDAEMIAKKAVEAACEFDDGCDLPVRIYSVDLKNNG